jgi:hypothetical protein
MWDGKIIKETLDSFPVFVRALAGIAVVGVLVGLSIVLSIAILRGTAVNMWGASIQEHRSERVQQCEAVTAQVLAIRELLDTDALEKQLLSKDAQRRLSLNDLDARISRNLSLIEAKETMKTFDNEIAKLEATKNELYQKRLSFMDALVGACNIKL